MASDLRFCLIDQSARDASYGRARVAGAGSLAANVTAVVGLKITH